MKLSSEWFSRGKSLWRALTKVKVMALKLCEYMNIILVAI